RDLAGHRDELFIATKAGYDMWPGPYGDWGSRKYLLASLDASLKRLGLEYVDVFYHHRPDPETPLEESMGALDQAVRSGKALYAGISNYGPDRTRAALGILESLGTPFVLHQPKYSMFVREPEHGLLELLRDEGVGCIVFSPLAQGLLSDRYLGNIPAGSRAAKSHGALQSDAVTDEVRARLRRLNEIAAERGQSLAQMAVAWVLRHPAVTSALVGASRVEQVEANVAALDHLDFSDDELTAIDETLAAVDGA
ncbi:MAG: aldo/keto reductase, partial [Gemmatimonadota bacterium]